MNFEVKPGEMIGLVGHSGSGKSTLINLVSRFYDVNEGEILIDGVNIRRIEQAHLRSQIGVVLQETFLFGGTILDNIRYSKPDATYEEVLEAAKIANAHDFILRLPDGYDTRLEENGSNLSGGERQRLAIARAVLNDPRILILDEATASLDIDTETAIQEALQRVTRNRTTLAIAHRLRRPCAMPTGSSCSTKAESPKSAPMPSWWHEKAFIITSLPRSATWRRRKRRRPWSRWCRCDEFFGSTA